MLNGSPHPLGSTITETGVRFSLFSSHATHVQLLLFDRTDSYSAKRIIELSPDHNRTSYYWHIEVPGIKAGQRYGYRVFGPFDPKRGHRFDCEKVLLDPYAKAVDASCYSRIAASRSGANDAECLRSVVVDASAYDWEGDVPLRHSFQDTVIYEMHVGGFTRNPNSGLPPETRGTYAGVIEKIPYLLELGISAVELMPIFQFDWQDTPQGLTNYWGYSPISFFAPHTGYSSKAEPMECINEFHDMVKALHRAGIEVILDVVYNHTAEGDDGGPTLCYRGIDNEIFYILSEDHQRYADYTGTGNTLNTNLSIVRRMIIDSLHYWVQEMHIDGFRFDLASILNRDQHGRPIPNAPILWDIDTDPILAGTKLIAEAWDAGGLYQVGSFGGNHWKEWNGRFRDDVRRFMKSDRDTVINLRERLLGSPDIYAGRHLPPEESVNYITCHDGFTLNDLVSYNSKHNEKNGERNRDGTQRNDSWNCGEEGPTDDPVIEALRGRQICNAFVLLLLSVGTPLLLMGDEVRRTQDGNNNAYCQDNELSWFDWGSVTKYPGLLRLVRRLIGMRRQFLKQKDGTFVSLPAWLENAQFVWHGTHLQAPDFSPESHTLAVTVSGDGFRSFHLILNAFWEPLRFNVPAPPSPTQSWRCVIDTALDSSHDTLEEGGMPAVRSSYCAQSRSVVLLLSDSNNGEPTREKEKA